VLKARIFFRRIYYVRHARNLHGRVHQWCPARLRSNFSLIRKRVFSYITDYVWFNYHLPAEKNHLILHIGLPIMHTTVYTIIDIIYKSIRLVRVLLHVCICDNRK